MNEPLRPLPRTVRGIPEPRRQFSIRLPMALVSRIGSEAERLGITQTEAVARLVAAGLDHISQAYDPNAQFDAIGYTLGAIADRLDQLDRAAAVTARAAIKGTMISRRELMKSVGDRAEASALDDQLNASVEAHLKEQGVSL